MNYKFTFLLLFCLISLKIDAALGLVSTESNLYVYQDIQSEALIKINKESDWLTFAAYDIEIDEKLGSYQLHKSLIAQSSHLSLSSYDQINEHTISLAYEVKFKKDIFPFTCILAQSSTNPNEVVVQIKGEFPAAINHISFQFQDASSAIYGGGIQFSHCNLRSQKFLLVVEENGVGRGDKGPTFLANLFGAAGNEHTTYAPLPNFTSSNLIHYQLSSGEQNALWEVDFSSALSLVFEANFLGNTDLSKLKISVKQQAPLAHIQSLHQPEKVFIPQDWMNGYILGVQGGKEKVNQLIQNLQKHQVELSAIWIQDWVGKRQTPIGSRLQWDWRANDEYYPDLKTWIDSLHQENIKVLGYINPYFVEGGQQADIGISQGYFVKDAKGEAYKFKAGGFNAYMIDLSNNEARSWMKNIIQTNLLHNGFDGWMCDFGEWLPFSNIQVAEDFLQGFYHNDFPKLWTNLNWEAVDEFVQDKEALSSRDYFIYNRSWYSESNERPNIMWLGDQMGSFGEHDGLASAVKAYNSASLSGFPLVHSDIGGYTAIKLGPFKYLRDDEVLKRWIEMEAFTPLWRSHEGLKPDHMSQIYQDDEMMTFFAKFDKIHQALIQSHFARAYQELLELGIPVVRHPFLMYPYDQNTYDLQYQFFVGPNLLVCPVVVQGAQQVKAYLPEGTWQHFFTKVVFEGNKFYNFDAPIGQPAVFEKL